MYWRQRRRAIVSAIKTGYKLGMNFTRISLLILMTSLASIVAGCGGDAAYVYDVDEFNRQSKTYLNGITDRDEVTVCYSKRSTSALEVAALARKECAKFDKTAQFFQQSYQACPLATPVAALYKCLGKDQTNVSSGFN